MKRISRFIIMIFLTVSASVCTVSGVDYSNFDITYAVSDACADYTNNETDDRLQYRSNCYGFAMRLHYGEGYDSRELPYSQLAGEFWDRTNSYLTFGDLYSFYLRDRNNDGKAFDLETVYQFIGFDCDTLGYNLTFVSSYGPNDSFVPPSASSQKGKRLIALVGREDGEDVHFYMQNSDNTWSHKSGNESAKTKCVECNVILKILILVLIFIVSHQRLIVLFIMMGRFICFKLTSRDHRIDFMNMGTGIHIALG